VLKPWIVLMLAGIGATAAPALAQPAEQSGNRAALAAQLQLAGEAIAANPKDPEPLARRAELNVLAGRSAEAIADYDRLIELFPERAALYDARGSEQFKLGKMDESIADFDRALKLQPDQEPWHWKRGISYYYAGRWDAGRKQFEGYQTVDDNDVENAVWRFLCMAREQGVPAARGDLLKIKRDLRVPMMEVYDLYQGKLRPDYVLRAANAGEPDATDLNQRLFYAHLYLGLYYEVTGDAAKAKEHIELATRHKIFHYMWNVADVHAKRLTADK
jgi:lipoprotein NlpI